MWTWVGVMRTGLSKEVALKSNPVLRKGEAAPWSGSRASHIQKWQAQSLRCPWCIRSERRCVPGELVSLRRPHCAEHGFSRSNPLPSLPFIPHTSHRCLLTVLTLQACFSLRAIYWLRCLPGMLFRSYLPVQLSLSSSLCSVFTFQQDSPWLPYLKLYHTLPPAHSHTLRAFSALIFSFLLTSFNTQYDLFIIHYLFLLRHVISMREDFALFTDVSQVSRTGPDI